DQVLCPRIAQVQRMGVALAAIAEDGDLLVLDQVHVAIAVVVNAHRGLLGCWGFLARCRRAEVAIFAKSAECLRNPCGYKSHTARITLDDTARRVLRHLLADPQADNATLADRAGVTTATLWRRLDRLRERGVLRATEARIDWRALGYAVEG